MNKNRGRDENCREEEMQRGYFKKVTMIKSEGEINFVESKVIGDISETKEIKEE